MTGAKDHLWLAPTYHIQVTLLSSCLTFRFCCETNTAKATFSIKLRDRWKHVSTCGRITNYSFILSVEIQVLNEKFQRLNL